MDELLNEKEHIPQEIADGINPSENGMDSIIDEMLMEKMNEKENGDNTGR